MRALAVGLMAFGSLLTIVDSGQASTLGMGTFLGAFPGNTTPISNIQQVIDEILEPNIQGQVTFYAKVEIDDDDENDINLESVGPRGTLTLNNVNLDDHGEELSGDWSFSPNLNFDPLPLVTILAIKAGNYFGLWFYSNNTDPFHQHGAFDAEDLGSFDVGELNDEVEREHGESASAISHISVYGNVGVSVVPLPAALPLFLTALAGLGGLSYRRRRKALSA